MTTKISIKLDTIDGYWLVQAKLRETKTEYHSFNFATSDASMIVRGIPTEDTDNIGDEDHVNNEYEVETAIYVLTENINYNPSKNVLTKSQDPLTKNTEKSQKT